jgi:hypothetical protein
VNRSADLRNLTLAAHTPACGSTHPMAAEGKSRRRNTPLKIYVRTDGGFRTLIRLRADHLTNSCRPLLGLSGWRAVILWQIVLEKISFDDVDISRIDRHRFGNILPGKIVIPPDMLNCPSIISLGEHRIDLDRLRVIGQRAVSGCD